MAYHHTLEHYKEQFKEAEDQYIEMMKGDNAASVLMKWVVENEVTDIFYPLIWDEKTNTLEGFVELYRHLRWCLYDDGIVDFYNTERGPVIYFGWEEDDCLIELPQKWPLQGKSRVTGFVDFSVGWPWGFMKAWEERHDYWIKDRNRFKQWISWSTYKENYTGDDY
jgi:hypothetical protein